MPKRGAEAPPESLPGAVEVTMDVYFERIAGVAERRPERRVPQVAGLVVEAPEPSESGHEEVALDENGFPLSPLKDQDELWFVQASQLYEPLRNCAGVARGSGTLLILGGLVTGLVGLLSVHVVTIVTGLILVTLGSIERSSGNDVAAAKPTAPGRLAVNQLMLLGLVVLYCLAQMKGFHTAYAKTGFGAEQLAAALPTQLAPLGQELGELGPVIESMAPRVVYGFHAPVIAASLVFQGGMALYYLSRKRKVRLFHEELPPWVGRLSLTFIGR